LLSHRDSGDKYQHTVKTVWQLSFDRLQSRHPLAAQILNIYAFLQPDSIPMSLFERQTSALELGSVSQLSISSPTSEEDQQNQRTARAAVAVLIKFSFLTRISSDVGDDSTSIMFSIHRLVQKLIYDAMDG